MRFHFSQESITPTVMINKMFPQAGYLTPQFFLGIDRCLHAMFNWEKCFLFLQLCLPLLSHDSHDPWQFIDLALLALQEMLTWHTLAATSRSLRSSLQCNGTQCSCQTLVESHRMNFTFRFHPFKYSALYTCTIVYKAKVLKTSTTIITLQKKI